MSLLFAIFRPWVDLIRMMSGTTKPDPISIVPEDEIFPVHYFDDTEMNRYMIMCCTMRFDDVLDPEYLHSSLARLLEIGDWRKLGGRLRLGATGKLEIHVPEKFTQERPAVRYSSIKFDINIGDHPLASKLPKATDSPSIHPGPVEFRDLGTEPGAPVSINDYLNSDEPQLALHVVSFSDSTLVSLSWPHTLMDGMGRRALFVAWCQVLAGKESEVLPLLGGREDPISALGTTASANGQEEQYVLADKRLRGFSIIWFLFRVIYDIFWTPKTLQTMMLPRKAVSGLVQRARADLSNRGPDGNSSFISEGDVLTAWATRMAVSILPPHSTRSVTVLVAFDIRGRLKSLFSHHRGVYVQNLILFATAVLPATEVLDKTLGHLALRIRQTITSQTTEPQIQAQARTLRQSFDASGHGPWFGEADSLAVFFSNWSKIDFFNVVDFSPAVMHESAHLKEKESDRTYGKPTYFHCQTLQTKAASSNIFNILGTDAYGNVWITGYVPPSVWPRIEDELREVSLS